MATRSVRRPAGFAGAGVAHECLRGWRRRLAAALAWSAASVAMLAGLLVAGPAAAQSDWTFCADEAETCHVGRAGVIRFGAPGRWAHKRASGEVRCDTRTFGDPAPGRRKECQVARDWNDPGETHDGNWRYCAREGESCDVGGRARVRFGAQGRYAVREMSGRVDCDTRRFGDPAPGVFKHCQVEKRGWGGGGGGNDGGSAGGDWRRCASEGATCRVSGRAQVRFGVAGRYAYRDADGSIECRTSTFGDPAPGRPKRCDYRPRRGGGGWNGGNGGGGSGSQRPPPQDSEWAGPDNGLVWNRCASEGGTCSVRGTRLVRFGADGRYQTRQVRGSVTCNASSFGGDPAPGRRKACEYRVN